MNHQIRARSVRVVDENGKQIGIMNIGSALNLAQERGLDLVEVSPNATPPVCKLMDYGKFKYTQRKKLQSQRKHQKETEIKEIKLRPLIDRHDLETKMRSIHQFLSEGNKVRLNVFFRGREIAHPEIAEDLLKRIAEMAKERGKVESPPVLEGKKMSMVLAPYPRKEEKKESKREDKNLPLPELPT